MKNVTELYMCPMQPEVVRDGPGDCSRAPGRRCP